ncbi:TPA: mechanosensitive ion channel [Enterobacter hormaechei subsp. steigerwaltii]|nr:mechanosensitive ion channel [Enterobacter hormaechei subsp. steigerwaltii]
MLKEWLFRHIEIAGFLSVLLIFVGGGVTFLIFNFFISRLIVKGIVGCESCHSDDMNRRTRIYRKIAVIASLLVTMALSVFLPNTPPPASRVIILATTCLLIVLVAWFASNLLDTFNSRYSEKYNDGAHSIKGYIQTGKIIVFSGALILIIATLADKSPLIILSGLGAVAAVILLLFQHTLISLVANIQVSSSDAIRLGDWLEIPHLNIDGVVTELALHTTTIRNWNNTVSRIPTRTFITEHFTNWQPMFISGGRRIKRAFYIDQKSVTFLDDKMTAALRELPLFSDFATVEQDSTAIFQENNLGAFREYIRRYLQHRKDIRQDMTLMVRQLAPGPEGLPVEIYCFTSQVSWVAFEEVQSEIFEFVIAVAGMFSLNIYQRYSGE